MAWRLLAVASEPEVGMSFGTMTYYTMIDTAEAMAHEFAATHLTDGNSIIPPFWNGLKLRRLLGDPFDLTRRALLPSVDTLTIRACYDGHCFVLHDRKAANVAVAGGTLHIMPAGVFQPSSIVPEARVADFDLWRNIMREYSEEFLGNPEHDGDGEPADYTEDPFRTMDAAYCEGEIRIFCLGVALDALTLRGEILSVAVFAADAYDTLFAGMVDSNAEGSVIKTGRAHPTPLLPFTENVVQKLLASGRLAPAAAGCLQLAWTHRRTILGAA